MLDQIIYHVGANYVWSVVFQGQWFTMAEFYANYKVMPRALEWIKFEYEDGKTPPPKDVPQSADPFPPPPPNKKPAPPPTHQKSVPKPPPVPQNVPDPIIELMAETHMSRPQVEKFVCRGFDRVQRSMADKNFIAMLHSKAHQDDKKAHDKIFRVPKLSSGDRLQPRAEIDKWTPNYWNPRPYYHQCKFEFKSIVPKIPIYRGLQFDEEGFGNAINHMMPLERHEIYPGVPRIHSKDMFRFFGYIMYWNRAERWGRVMGLGVCAHTWDWDKENARWYLKFVPMMYDGDAYTRADVPLDYVNDFGDPQFGNDARSSVPFKGPDGNFLSRQRHVRQRASLEPESVYLAQIRAEDLVEGRKIRFERNIGLESHWCTFDLVQGRSRYECRNVRMCRYKKQPIPYDDYTDVFNVLPNLELWVPQLQDYMISAAKSECPPGMEAEWKVVRRENQIFW